MAKKINLSDSEKEFLQNHATILNVDSINVYQFDCSFIEGSDGEWEKVKGKFGDCLNGNYSKEFNPKQKIVRELLESKKVDYDTLNILMDNKLYQYCSKTSIEGKYFWFVWQVSEEDSIDWNEMLKDLY